MSDRSPAAANAPLVGLARSAQAASVMLGYKRRTPDT